VQTTWLFEQPVLLFSTLYSRQFTFSSSHSLKLTLLAAHAHAGVATTTIRGFGSSSGSFSIDLVKAGEGSVTIPPVQDGILQRWGDYSAAQVVDNRFWFAVPVTRLSASTSSSGGDGHGSSSGHGSSKGHGKGKGSKSGSYHSHPDPLDASYASWISARSLE
jgi:hypothetical protein